MEDQRPIIVKRIKKVAGGHHGGAWKVAFADFATAMMAFFMVLWLSITATPEQKKAVEGYFHDPVGFTEGGAAVPIDLGGSPQIAITQSQSEAQSPPAQVSEQTIEQAAAKIEEQKLEDLMQEIKVKIQESQTLNKFKDQLMIDITSEGLRIQIVDKSQRPMFDSGSSKLKPYSEDILFELASAIATVPNKISVTGHTDASPFGDPENGYSNWELSADRANAARRALMQGGLPEERIARVVGLGSSVLFDQEDPLAPVNRRIAIIVLNKKTLDAIEGKTLDGKTPPGPKPTVNAPVPAEIKPELNKAFERAKPIDPKELIW